MRWGGENILQVERTLVRFLGPVVMPTASENAWLALNVGAGAVQAKIAAQVRSTYSDIRGVLHFVIGIDNGGGSSTSPITFRGAQPSLTFQNTSFGS
jgi:hypothetical protein